jgi:hypothetical protein
MSLLNDKLKKWALELIEEGGAETVVEMAIDKLPPVVILTFVAYGSFAVSILFGLAGWYFDTLHVLSFVFAGFSAFIGAVLYGIRVYIVSKLSALVLQGYRHAKERVLGRNTGAVEESVGGLNQQTVDKNNKDQ